MRIELARESMVHSVEEPLNWRLFRKAGVAAPQLGPDEVNTVSSERMLELLSEDHHGIYGRPWAVGRSYTDYLLERGLRTSDRVLDFGCGGGRLGVNLIDYLDPGHYFGLDSHLFALQAFAFYEIPMRALAHKRPRLLLDDAGTVSHFGETFNVIIDAFVTHHFGPKVRLSTFEALRDVAAPGCQLHWLSNKPEKLHEAREAGWEVVNEVVYAHPLLTCLPEEKRAEHWRILALQP